MGIPEKEAAAAPSPTPAKTTKAVVEPVKPVKVDAKELADDLPPAYEEEESQTPTADVSKVSVVVVASSLQTSRLSLPPFCHPFTHMFTLNL
jgi:hypothetical protein